MIISLPCFPPPPRHIWPIRWPRSRMLFTETMGRGLGLIFSPQTSSITLFVLFFLSLNINLARAQTNGLFEWAFETVCRVLFFSRTCSPFIVQPISSGRIPSCGSLSISLSNRDGVPPYSMQAFAVDGTPKTSQIGSDPSNLRWTPNHPVGTRLLLVIVDSRGSTSQTSEILYTVTGELLFRYPNASC